MTFSSKIIQVGTKALISRTTAQVPAKGAVIVGMQHTASCLTSSDGHSRTSTVARFVISQPKPLQSRLQNKDVGTSNGNTSQNIEILSDSDSNKFNASKMISKNITHNSFTLPEHLADDANDFSYDQDYDEYNLHMTPSSTTSQDGEHLSELDMIRPDDVGAVLGDKVPCSYYNDEDDEYFDYEVTQDGCYEFEEDWEIMHNLNLEKSGDSGPCDVLDNIDDVNDFVL
mmetsp:Transcript_31842/g.68766  ORF Transcript_31842/g.68766 Transcript_31842/m.68766 type:complete len:228 (+) Transcript_31842:942-1625(+)